MALQIEGNHLCKIFYAENGKAFTRRVTAIHVHRCDGQVVRLVGQHLPDSISLYTGGQSDGKGLLEVIEHPAQSVAPLAPQAEQPNVVNPPRRFFSERDGFIFIAGMLASTVLFMWVFTAWVELRDFRMRALSQAPNSRSYQSR